MRRKNSASSFGSGLKRKPPLRQDDIRAASNDTSGCEDCDQGLEANSVGADGTRHWR